MPFVKNTPESLLARSDSLDPKRTCHGITSAGLPCRRPLASPVSAGMPSSFCWQHREQSATSTPVKGAARRSSIDTLAERLGIASLEEKKRKTGKGNGGGKGPKAEGKGGGTLRCCFCFHVPIEEAPKPRPRPQPRPVQRPEKTASTPAHLAPSTPTKTKPHSSPGKLGSSPAHLSPSPKPRTSASYLSLIPPTTDPQTASLLLSELARPHLDSEEPGYIYMFWMTPPSRGAPPADAARALLSASGRRSSGRPSDAVGSFAGDGARGAGGKATMLLKIGRASNVQRRMNEWSRQCGYAVEVLRFYPYVPYASSPSPSSSPGAKASPRLTPHVKRVERLIHLELAGMGLKADRGKCEACGREHREWFEVEGSRRGVGRVDEVIRRWVEWDEGVGGG